MEHLFSTSISIGNKNTRYEVYFNDEKYTFQPEVPENQSPSFSFKRENDEWHDQQSMNADVRNQAIEALESYLLSQH